MKNFTLTMFRFYRILVQYQVRNDEMLNSNAGIAFEIINEIKAILENKVIKPFIKWFEKNSSYDKNAENYIDQYYKKGNQDNNLCADFPGSTVDAVKKNVERSMEKYDKEKLSKKDK